MPRNDKGRTAAPGPDIKAFASKRSYNNLTVAELYEQAIVRGEGHVAQNGPFVVLTGQHTGRSAADKFVVRDASSEKQVWWDNNKPMSPAHFDALYASMFDYAKDRELFVTICSAEQILITVSQYALSPNWPGIRFLHTSF